VLESVAIAFPDPRSSGIDVEAADSQLEQSAPVQLTLWPPVGVIHSPDDGYRLAAVIDADQRGIGGEYCIHQAFRRIEQMDIEPHRIDGICQRVPLGASGCYIDLADMSAHVRISNVDHVKVIGWAHQCAAHRYLFGCPATR
jgi:hypothetical protein